MTKQDHEHPLPHAYENSIWPMEIGGPRRQKHARSPGLNIQPDEKLEATTRFFSPGSWVMGTFVADDRMYVIGCSVPFQSARTHGWVEQIDPVTLECIKASPDLRSGGHNWCGGGAMLSDRTSLIGIGRYIHKLNFDLEVVGELELPIDHAHNGLTVLSDGMVVTRNLEADESKNSWFTVFDPVSMEVVERFEFVGSSIGRFSVDAVPGADHIYATTTTHVHRLIYKDKTLTLDKDWSASYDLPGQDQSFAWCNLVSKDNVWFMDMGENKLSRQIMTSYPVGSQPLDFGDGNQVSHHAPLHVFRVSTTDSSDMDALTPFGDADGYMGAAPLFVQDKSILVAFDTRNGKTGAWRYDGPGQFTELWVNKIRNTNQILYYPDTGEVVFDDFKDDNTVDAVVVDIETGDEKGRTPTNTMSMSGMAFGPGFDRDFYAGSGVTGALYRVFVSK